jgi:sugar fermentation stimulation protein A
MKKFLFKKPLTEGVIKSRPNRFLMVVEINKKKHICHCPSTGRIGNIVFNNIPCLLSKAENPDRKTKYTVEAISLDNLSKKNKNWIGINQIKMNKYVQFYLEQNLFKKMTDIKNKKVEREKKLGNSRIDFKINKDYVEVKMLLIHLPSRFDKLANLKTQSKFDSFNRLIKHFGDLAKAVKKEKARAVILTCYQYNAKPFVRPEIDKTNSKIIKAARSSTTAGVESWQANFKIDKNSVTLIKYFKLKLF